jgi:hypothetical protein
MTTGDQRPDKAPAEAQIVIGRVADALEAGEPAGDVEGFETLPTQVQQALNGLSPDEGQLIAQTLRVLEDNGFYCDLPDGGIVGFM